MNLQKTKPEESHVKQISIVKKNVLTLISIYSIILQVLSNISAQSIGYYPNSNLGFNPYLSPVFGYGLGLPYGTYNYNGLNKPNLSLLNSLHGGGVNNWMSKLHAKSILKKLSSTSLHPYNGGIKNKLTLLKHPEYAYTPYGVEYGLGKHYGSALIPNYPYKGANGDYYSGQSLSKKYASSNGLGGTHQHIDNLAESSSNNLESLKTYAIIKPLIKAGALITTAALLSKKTMESPVIKLNPSGMIKDG